MESPRRPGGDDAFASTERHVGEQGDEARGSLERAFDAARPEDPPGLPLARARVASALFGAVSAGGLGRFRVLERLGAGGMGVVYAAYDTTLDRGVALKLVHLPGRANEAALAEAKALARLSHPNVVPVYDVGVDGEHVYIVMELVRGETLRRWVKGRDRGEILGAYRQAGEALAAAHATGLVHRDFKPDNAIVGTDGRVRVVDFGLACEAAEPSAPREGRLPIAGTPGYMAPEQVAGMHVTAAADQYSFAVSLASALTEGAPQPVSALPRWLAVVLDRGRAADPAARFPSMRDLLRALARDPARVRRRRTIGAVAAVVTLGALVVGREILAARADACSDGHERLATAWASDDRAAGVARLATLGEYGRAIAPRLERQLRDYAAQWSSGYRDACLARRGGVQSEGLVDRRLACLERGRGALRSVAEIVRSADAPSLPEVVLAVRALPEPSECADLDALLAEVPPPPPTSSARVAVLRGALEEARVQIAAGRFEQARAAGHRAAEDARTLGYDPLLAETLLVEGHARMMMDGAAGAVPALSEAAKIAFRVGADAVGIEAWARRAWAEATGMGGASALAGLDVVEGIAARTSSARFARALLYNNVGSVALAQDDRARAQSAFRRALDESRGVAGRGAVELLNVRVNLGLTADQPADRDRLLAEAEGEMAKLLGEDHPDTLQARWTRGMMTVPLARADDVLRPACERFALHVGLAARAAECWTEVGYVARELGDEAGSLAAMDRAVAAGPTDAARPYVALLRGDARAAADGFAAALSELPEKPREPWWQSLRRADLELGLGRARLAAGELGPARRSLEASVTRLDPISREHPAAAIDRRLARARVELAKALSQTGATADEIARVASAALASLRAEGVPASEIHAVEQLASPR